MAPLLDLGRIEDVVTFGSIALDAEARAWEQFILAARGYHALGCIELDDLGAAAAAVEPRSLADTPRVDAVVMKIALGRLELERGRSDIAANDLTDCKSWLDDFGFRGCDTLPWAGVLFEALWRSGRKDDAAQMHEEYAERARIWGTARATAKELRMRSRLEPDDRIDLLRESVSVGARGETILDRLHVQKELGDAYALGGNTSDARIILHEVVDRAAPLGCRLLTRQALASLTAAGGRPRRVARSGLESLTPTEKQIATLAARGHSNAEIAESLFVSVRTVKFHLSNVFRKLGIEGRLDIVRLFE